MSDSKELIAAINRAVSEDGFELNEWETNFLENVGRKAHAGQELSDRQDEILQGIWKRATA
jgi:hypothetical protein